MKRANTFLTLLMAVLTIMVAGSAFAGRGMGAMDGSGPMLDIYEGVPVTVSGTVTEIGIQGAGMSVDDGSQIVTVYGIGPVSYWDAAAVARPQVGEQVTVDAYEVTFSDGTTKLIAAAITVGDTTLTLRDPETGAPAWRGAARGAGARGGMGGGAGLRDGSCLAQ